MKKYIFILICSLGAWGENQTLQHQLPESAYNYPNPLWVKSAYSLAKDLGKDDVRGTKWRPPIYETLQEAPREFNIAAGGYILNNHIFVTVRCSRYNSALQVFYFLYTPSGMNLIRAKAYQAAKDADEHFLFDFLRIASHVPYYYGEDIHHARLERIGNNEYIATIPVPLVSSKGLIPREFRIVVGYVKGNGMLCSPEFRPEGLGENILQCPELNEKTIRGIQLQAYREIHDFVFAGKGSLLPSDFKPKINEQDAKKGLDGSLDAKWQHRAACPGWKRNLEDERDEHPERFLCKMEDGNIPDEYAAYFHLPELSWEGVFPNINCGVAAGDAAVKALVKSVYGKKAKVTKVEGGVHSSLAEVKVEEDTLYIRVEHLPYRHMAMYRLLERYPRYWNPYDESKLAAVRQGRGLVGDFDLWRAPLLDENGIPVKNSGNNLVVFLRGNTLVELRMEELLHPNRDFDLRLLARAIDKLLIEGMRKAGEPLTKEQDYADVDSPNHSNLDGRSYGD